MLQYPDRTSFIPDTSGAPETTSDTSRRASREAVSLSRNRDTYEEWLCVISLTKTKRDGEGGLCIGFSFG